MQSFLRDSLQLAQAFAFSTPLMGRRVAKDATQAAPLTRAPPPNPRTRRALAAAAAAAAGSSAATATADRGDPADTNIVPAPADTNVVPGEEDSNDDADEDAVRRCVGTVNTVLMSRQRPDRIVPIHEAIAAYKAKVSGLGFG